MKQKANRTYMTTRTQYKDAKKFDHAQFDAFCTKIYTEGYKDGRNSVPGADVNEVMAAIGNIKGIGTKKLEDIRASIETIFTGGETA